MLNPNLLLLVQDVPIAVLVKVQLRIWCAGISNKFSGQFVSQHKRLLLDLEADTLLVRHLTAASTGARVWHGLRVSCHVQWITLCSHFKCKYKFQLSFVLTQRV